MPAAVVGIVLLLAAAPAAPSPQAPGDLAGLNSEENEVVVSFAGNEAWLERKSGAWGEPDGRSTLLHAERSGPGAPWRVTGPAPWSGEHDGHDEGDPFWDEATRTLWFTSDRPHPDLPESRANVWLVRRGTDGAWGEPEPLPAPVNGPGAEYSPVVRGGRLYFASYRDGGGGVYVAEAEESGGWRVEKLGAAINGPGGEWNVWVSEDESLMIFEASGRETNVTTSGDLYASLRDSEGRWLPAIPLTEINGPGSDLHGRVVGDQLVYASSSEHPEHTDLYAVPWEPLRERVRKATRSTD